MTSFLAPLRTRRWRDCSTALALLVQGWTVLWGDSEDDYGKDRKEDLEMTVRNWEVYRSIPHQPPNVSLIAFIYYSVSWETKSLASRDNGWCTLYIYSHLKASLFLSPRLTECSAPCLELHVCPLLFPKSKFITHIGDWENICAWC